MILSKGMNFSEEKMAQNKVVMKQELQSHTFLLVEAVPKPLSTAVEYSVEISADDAAPKCVSSTSCKSRKDAIE